MTRSGKRVKEIKREETENGGVSTYRRPITDCCATNTRDQVFVSWLKLFN